MNVKSRLQRLSRRVAGDRLPVLAIEYSDGTLCVDDVPMTQKEFAARYGDRDVVIIYCATEPWKGGKGI